MLSPALNRIFPPAASRKISPAPSITKFPLELIFLADASNTASISLIAETRSALSAVARFSTVPISSCNSLIASTKFVVITTIASDAEASLFNSTVCKSAAAFTAIVLTLLALTLAVAAAYPKILISDEPLNDPLLFFVFISLVLACKTVAHHVAFSSTPACVVWLAAA